MRRIAVIGSGATALAVLDALADRPGLHVTLIRPQRRLPPRVALNDATSQESRHEADKTILALRRDLGLKFPPPKTHFGVAPDTIAVRDWGNIWRSNLHGGLTQFWGGSMVPFTDRELRSWPLTRADLESDYAAIGERVGITGGKDALGGYFDDGFASLPPVEAIPPIRVLIDRLAHNRGRVFDIIGGASRVAVETRAGRPTACEYSGECMTGCRRGAVFNALTHIEMHRARGTVVAERLGFAQRIDLDKKTLHVRSEDGGRSTCAYDLLFICGGCVHSVELLIDSLGTEPESAISDNMILSFPIFFGGKLPAEAKSGRYFALTNGMLVILPHDPQAPPVFVQLYPNPDYFWQYNLPHWSWPIMQGLGRMGRNRLFWARAYLPSAQSQHYRMTRTADGVELGLDRRPDLTEFLNHVWPELRRVLTTAGFWAPPLPPVKAKTSSHYAGGFPMGGRWVGKDGALGNGAYLCDSANFSDCPALSHTFTAMANARRIARLALLAG